MRVEKRDGTQERKILIGMIVDKKVLSRIASKWDSREGLFRSRWANLIAQWCVKFYRKYDDAPRQAIESMFEAWADRNRDKDTIKLVERFLNGLSAEYETLAEESNSEYIIDLASAHFNKVKATVFQDKLEGLLAVGEVDKAVEMIETGFHKVELGAGSFVDVLRDKEALANAFESKGKPLIVYPDALGEFFGDALERDGFVALMGPEKRGKSWMLQDLAWMAMTQRRKVAYFEVGDLTQNQILRRFMVRAAKRPIATSNTRFPMSIDIPKEIYRDPDSNFASVNHKTRRFLRPLSLEIGWKACEKIVRKLNTDECLLRLVCHPNATINVAGIKSVLQGWERDDWVPDVVVVDYADILAPPVGVAEKRDQINATWQQLRALSCMFQCRPFGRH